MDIQEIERLINKGIIMQTSYLSQTGGHTLLVFRQDEDNPHNIYYTMYCENAYDSKSIAKNIYV